MDNESNLFKPTLGKIEDNSIQLLNKETKIFSAQELMLIQIGLLDEPIN